MRDDFTKQTVTEIAKGVGYRCSNPDCTRPTVGANAEQDGIVTIGVAAHICAASPGGPRFDPVQAPEARRAKDNGIWLCQNCGRLIDADAKRFTVEILAGWKRVAQERAFRELVAPGVPAPTEETARVSSIIAADNKSATNAAAEDLFARIYAAANSDLSAYRRTPIWSGSAVELTLRLYDDSNAPSFNISKLPLAVEMATEVTIVAPPGTGKTTTLLQLAADMLSTKSIVPLYFRLGDWSAGSSSLLTNLHQRSSFKEITQDDVYRLAAHGRVLLLLDGWNELDAAARTKLRVELEQIRRDCPHVRIIATTRRQALDVPISGPRIAIEPLSEDQQMAIARTLFGAAGEKIVDEAWRTAGVRELIAIPLYLSALLSGGTQSKSPTTKDEVLRLFVQQHEQASNHAEILQTTLFGCHSQILIALASHLNAIDSTTMMETEARRIIMTTVAQLREQGQISGQPEPLTVLEVLTSHHTLMRSGTGNGAISFQHQQFQEWYASHEVVGLMRASARGETGMRVRLRAAVLDHPAWEESIFFAVERISREHDGVTAAAHSVRLALPVDPMLAAEMIYRAAPEVWETVKADILAFVDRWHRSETVDRAVRFMVITGRPEFASRIWPLVSSTDSQIQLPTLRTAPRFRPSVLGAGLSSKVAALPETIRENLIALIAAESGVDGMDLAAELARTDPSPKVQAEAVQYFLFRRADRHVAIILAEAHDETWSLLAKQGYSKEIHVPGAVERLRAETEKAIEQATTPLERLRLLVDQAADAPNRNAGITAAIADARFPVRDQHASMSLYYARQTAPTAVLQGLRQRLETGLELPFNVGEFLDPLDVIDEGPIVQTILDVGHDDRNSNMIAVLAGPKTAGKLIERYLACAQLLKTNRNDRTASEEYTRLRSRIAMIRVPSFLAAVMAHADSDDPVFIASLASLISVQGNDDDRKRPMPVDTSLKQQLIAILRRWVKVSMSSPNSDRYQLNEISNAIGRLGFRELLPELKCLLDEDLARLRKAIESYPDARKRGDIRATSDASMRYGNQYRTSFSRLGGEESAAAAAEYLEDRVFGKDAALILKAISDRQLNVPEPTFHRQWPWFDEVSAARAARTAPRNLPANTLSAPIFAAIDRLAKPDIDEKGQLLAIELARIALEMPHFDQDELIARVMALPQPLKVKQQLLAALALDGQVLDVNVVMQGVDEWLQEAQKATAEQVWHKRQNTWEIAPWLELLPLTTHPESLLDGLTRVKAFYGTGWAKHWERVLVAAAAVPGAQGEALLEALARMHHDIADDFEWIKAVLRRDSASAVLLYVDLFIEGIFAGGPHAMDPWQVARTIAPYIQKFPQLTTELMNRYEAVTTIPGRAMFNHLFGECGSENELIAMVKKYIATGQTYDGSMDSAVRAVALRKEPTQDSSNSFYIYPASVACVRKFLFDRLLGTSQEAALATNCLVAIDILRDEYGIAANDTRHPDVLSERPWPSEAERV